MMFFLVIVGTNARIILLTPRTVFVGIATLTFLGISLSCIRHWNSIRLLFSPADVGWLSLILLTAATVIFAQYPRSSLEIWLISTGLQLPLAYAILYLLRRHWKERAIYRGILAVSAY